jgi:hypothetical protein
MNVVRAFEQYNLLSDFVPLSGAELTALDAYTVWLVQRGLLNFTDVDWTEPRLSKVAREGDGRQGCARIPARSAPKNE